MMNAPKAHARRTPDIAALLARWLLGALFIWLGASKVLHHAEFLTFVRQQFVVANPFLSGLIAAVWPGIEVVYGLWLISGMAQGTAALLARWWLGAVFVYMGLNKAFPHPEAFLKLVRDYHMVSSPVLLNAIGAALPWFEVYCGLLLLAGVAVRGTALNLIAMLVPFTLLVLKRALEIAAATGKPFCAVKFDCGCGAGEVYICHKLVENSALLLLAAWLLAGQGRQLCLRYGLFRREPAPGGSESNVAEPVPRTGQHSPAVS
jgi:uncharacterized membrane protein YphA (DoxX/SURF4 family)